LNGKKRKLLKDFQIAILTAADTIKG